MTRPVSAENYEKIKENGLLSKRRFQVYDAIYQGGPMTQSEAWVWIVNKSGEKIQRPSISPRFAELEARGVLTSVGQRPCQVTGQTALVWEVTPNLPAEPKERKEGLTANERIKLVEMAVEDIRLFLFRPRTKAEKAELDQTPDLFK